MGLVLLFLFLAVVAFFSGAIVVVTSDEKGRNFGFGLIVFAVLISIVALLIYGAGNYNLWGEI